MIDLETPDLQEKFRSQAEMLANRVKKRFRQLRKHFARQNIEVFRLYDWDIPEIRAVVDWYAGHLVIGEYTRKQSSPQWLPMMGAAVADGLGVVPENVHLKKRVYGTAGGKRYERIDCTGRMIVVSERDLKFLVNPWDYVDTGLFSDHRNTRQMVREMSGGKRFLNLFCYTGSFSCYAALGGARLTASVDRSKTAIDWAGKNLALNGIGKENNTLVHSHAFEFLDRAKRQRWQFDLAVVDPPSFWTRRSNDDRFDIAVDHPLLLNAVIEVMIPGSILFFSTNHQDFSPRMDRVNASEAVEITSQTIPEDYLNRKRTVHRCWRIIV
jgi:23S rRNA (cytosine1962-C5)-methyltransferase